MTEHLVGYFVDAARRTGTSWAEVGQHLGVSRQAVQKRYATPEIERDGKRPGYFDRMVPAGKHTIVIAQDQAQHRHARRIGTEHLLLGLCGKPDATGALALARCDAPPATITAAINGRIGLPSGEKETEKLPFSPAGQRVLQHALREALRLEHDYVGTGHLALGCLTVTEGTASEVLVNLGVGYEALRDAVRDLSAAEHRPAS
ncbi:MAG: Clp protease N-terminal domain-containing protein [Nocardioidaceae bacterium]